MRDRQNDKDHNKKTLVVILGVSKAKIYHYALLVLAMFSALLFTATNFQSPIQFIYIIAFIPILLNIKTVYLNKESKLLDSELKKVALSTFLFALLFSLF